MISNSVKEHFLLKCYQSAFECQNKHIVLSINIYTINHVWFPGGAASIATTLATIENVVF